MSQFYNNLNKLEEARDEGIINLQNKGIIIDSNSSIPTIIRRINDIQVNSSTTTLQTTGNATIITAELPNVTIDLKDGENIIETKTTDGTTGGIINFDLTSSTLAKTYTLRAVKESTELWTKEITVNGIGVYNCKVGKLLKDYTPQEVIMAAENHYAKYMWSIGDEFITSFEGVNTTFIIIGFDHDIDINNNPTGITFMIKNGSNMSYRINSTNDNNLSWVGCELRKNCLKMGDVVYTIDKTVSSSSSGNWFIFDNTQEKFIERTLPTDFNASEMYYTQSSVTENGSLINGLTEFKDSIKCVKKKTSNGTLGGKTQKLITTNDYIFIPSASEVYGNQPKLYGSTYALWNEGLQYKYFNENWDYNKIALNKYWWLRSPYLPSVSYFCGVGRSGSLASGSMSGSNSCRFCFCI